MAARRSANARNGVLNQFKEQATALRGILTSGAQLAKEEATQRISKAKQTLKDEAVRVVEDQKDWAAGEIGSVGSAIHEAARKLHHNHIDAIAGYVDAAARRFDDVAHYLEDHELAEVIDPVADVVRKHPMAFIAGFLAAGILLGRFIKAGEPPPVPEQEAQRKPGKGAAARSRRNRRSGRS